MQTIEKSAKTVEDAIAAALEELGAHRDEVEITVLEEGDKGFLGFGKKEARVRVTLPEPAVPEPAEEAAADAPAQTGKIPGEARIHAFLDGLFAITGEDVTVTVSQQEDRVVADLSGPDMGIVIGKRGETLDALQHLTSLYVNRGDAAFVHLTLDCENYRAKRAKSLEQFAANVAKKVAKTRRSVTLEPMSAYERRIIHSAMQNHPEVTTYSTGQGPGRRVVVCLKSKAPKHID